MDQASLTPEESILLIGRTIEQTRQRFRESGHIIVVWGVLIFVVTLAQYLLIRWGMAEQTGLPPLLYTLGAVYTFLYGWRQRKKNIPKTVIGSIIGTMGWVVGMNLMILGFLFWNRIGETPVPVFLILLAIFVVLTGQSIAFKPLLLGGMMVNVLAFACFFLDWHYHPLIMSAGSVVALIVPGLLLNKEQRNKHV